MPLADEKCSACTPDSPLVSDQQAAELLRQLPDWQIVPFDNINHLVKAFTFKNFADAMAFTIEIGELAEATNHHPTLITTWGKVTIHWWTHATSGLHRNDFVMAARTDRVFAKF